MAFDNNSDKHRVMRDLLAELHVENPESPQYYSTGSTITTAGLEQALRALRAHKLRIRELSRDLDQATR